MVDVSFILYIEVHIAVISSYTKSHHVEKFNLKIMLLAKHFAQNSYPVAFSNGCFPVNVT